MMPMAVMPRAMLMKTRRRGGILEQPGERVTSGQLEE